MGKTTVIPDAWEDDWESQADKADEQEGGALLEEPVKITKAERLAQHAETNKKIWESAETPETFHYLATRDNVPLKTEFKPTLKVLSRKPAPKIISRQDPVTGLSNMTIEDDDEEEEDLKKNQKTAEERRIQAQKDREEKQKKYEEVRARLFGTAEPGSGSSSPGRVTPPVSGEEGKNSRGKGRGRGGRQIENRRPDSQPGTRELFDPNYTPKAGSVTIPRRGNEGSLSSRSTPRDDAQVIRTPKGPDSVGRGFGFSRGGKAG